MYVLVKCVCLDMAYITYVEGGVSWSWCRFALHVPLGTRRYCDVESTSLTLIQRRNNAVCPVGWVAGVRTFPRIGHDRWSCDIRYLTNSITHC